jgi:hypothetical protein
VPTLTLPVAGKLLAPLWAFAAVARAVMAKHKKRALMAGLVLKFKEGGKAAMRKGVASPQGVFLI